MRLTTKVDPINRDVALLINQALSPAARSQQFAEMARGFLAEADATNKAVLGRVPPSKTFVDGSEGASLDRVRPNGVIVREYQLIADLLVWIGEQLQRLSPVLTGRYRSSHSVFADGSEIQLGGRVPLASEYVFISVLPYARKIERGESSQAPQGVYEVVAAQARRRFGNVAKVGFAFRTALGGAIIGGRLGNRSEQRNPAIIVSVQ